MNNTRKNVKNFVRKKRKSVNGKNVNNFLDLVPDPDPDPDQDQDHGLDLDLEVAHHILLDILEPQVLNVSEFYLVHVPLCL